MMFKLSLRNAIRSFKDYLVYFLTLVVVVALYYVFASISYQPFIQSLSPEAITEITELLGRINVVLIFIVASFVLYANNFLLKRRSKELGVYLTMGISSIRINIMLFIEAIFIGSVAIITGIAFGIALTTLIGLLIVKMLGLTHVATPFILEPSSAFNAMKVFIIIFSGSALLNYFRIIRLKVVNLLNSFGKQRKAKKANKSLFIISLVIFAASVYLMVSSYYTFIVHGIDFGKDFIFNSVYMLAIGFLLFIASGTYLLSYIIERSERTKYKGINLFTFKKVTDSILKNVLVIGTIAVIMSITLVAVGMGFSYKSWLTESLARDAPYSFSLSSMPTDVNTDLYKKYIEDLGYEVRESANFYMYNTRYEQSDILNIDLLNRMEDKIEAKVDLRFIKVSDYNKLVKIIGDNPIELHGDEVAINTTNIFQDAIADYVKNNPSLTVHNNKVKLSTQRIYTKKINDRAYIVGGYISLIVPDDFATDENQAVTQSFIVNTTKDVKLSDSTNFRDYMFERGHQFYYISQSEQYEFNLKNATYKIVSSLFIGLILMIIAMSILSLHQMTDAIESRKNYNILSNLGVSSVGLKMSLLKQVCAYFLIPLAIALPNFIVGMVVISKWFGIAGAFSVSTALYTTNAIIIAIYVFFISITFSSCKSILKLS